MRGIPAWTVVLACVRGGQTRVGIIHDPVHDETHHAREGGGAFLDDQPIRCAPDARLTDGSVGVGFSGRTRAEDVARLIDGLLAEGGVFLRNASGALSLAYVSSGRLLGYAESHMNAWDCLAGQLLVAEAGGMIEAQDADAMIRDGGRVVVGAERRLRRSGPVGRRRVQRLSRGHSAPARAGSRRTRSTPPIKGRDIHSVTASATAESGDDSDRDAEPDAPGSETEHRYEEPCEERDRKGLAVEPDPDGDSGPLERLKQRVEREEREIDRQDEPVHVEIVAAEPDHVRIVAEERHHRPGKDPERHGSDRASCPCRP